MLEETTKQIEADTLRMFYNDYDTWMTWLDQPWYRRWFYTGPLVKFSKIDGLCGNLYRYAIHRGVDPLAVQALLKDQFEAANLYTLFPFNERAQDYSDEIKATSIHLNPKRREWVKQHTSTK